MLVKKTVRRGDRIGAEIGLTRGVQRLARGHRLAHLARGVTLFHHMPGQQPQQFPPGVHHRKGAEREPLFLDHFQHIPDELVGADLDRILNEPVDVVFDPAHLRELFPFGHVIMDQPKPAIQRHRNRHPRLGHRVHVGRYDRDLQIQSVGQANFEVRIPRENIRIQRGERHVIVSQRRTRLFAEKIIGLPVSRRVDQFAFRECCHPGSSKTRRLLARRNRSNLHSESAAIPDHPKQGGFWQGGIAAICKESGCGALAAQGECGASPHGASRCASKTDESRTLMMCALCFIKMLFPG